MPQAFTLALIICALLMRMLVPQGWMPVDTADGLRITICTGAGPVQIELPRQSAASDGTHHRTGDQGHGAAEMPCAFSGLALALDTPSLPGFVAPIVTLLPWLAGAPGFVTIGRGLAAPPPPATGPPLA
ncbi:hypothetical protein [Flavisphingomonas formosensis]|uniref:hypothetical protein n=1 Tax=Flavisphingomonas formosensis TaxID=861534 RepID=UPI001E5075A4|nr:hypothetical protein [Sphingomonas formosensis]